MSGDGPTKAAPEVEPLDDIILGDDDGELTVAEPPRSVPPPVHGSAHPPRASASSPPDDRRSARPTERRSSDRVRAAPDAKKRSKLTLRIPDDEISRPQLPATTPAGGIAAVVASIPPPPLDDMEERLAADDTLELPSEEVRARMAAITNEVEPPPKAVGVDASNDPGWTPFQPPVDISPHAAPVAVRHPSVAPEREAPISEEIPVETDLETETLGFEDSTSPRLPPPLDSEDIRIEEGDRVTDPGDALEVEPDDLVSVESLPQPHRPPPVKTTTGKHPIPQAQPSQPKAAAPAGSAAQPQAVAAPVPVVAPVTAVAPPAAASAPAAVHASRTRGGSSPNFIVPPGVGALAPPPMTDNAASRKKTRPWWEELFNDDYIRTMAKITDGQIRSEVNFVEESLGCEAGAMILDLACGTGRHAVELATRGYQVVGFDLSLAMLARASDEAQERKQKINFVQGDMREMTFDETFDGVYSWNTSFGYFDEEKNAAVVAKVHRALKKGGQFLLDVVNRDYIVRQAPSLAWFEGDGCICMDEMQIDFITSRMRVKRTLMMDDGRTKEIEYSIRVYALHELGKMLHDNGFRVAEVSGRTGTPGVFFGCEAPRTLILAEKR